MDTRHHADPLYLAMRRAQEAFYGCLLGSASAIGLILLLPKDPGEHMVRLAFTGFFFACALALSWSLTQPFRRLLLAAYAWRFQGCGPALEHTVKLYAHALSAFVAPLAGLTMALTSLTALAVLSRWPEFAALQGLGSVVDFGWWFCLLAYPVFIFLNSGRVMEIFDRRRQIAEQVTVTGFSPLTAADADRSAAWAAAPPVEVLGPGAFRAGGFDWTWSDFQKNCIVFGQPGTGKTLCILNALLDGFLSSTTAAGLPPSGLILDPKGDFRSRIRVLCERYGRERDLLVLAPGSPHGSIRWNPFDSDDDALEIAERFAAVLEILGMKNEHDTFWIYSAKTFLRHAVALIRITNPPGTPPSFEEVLRLARDRSACEDRLARLPQGHRGGQHTEDYFTDTWWAMSDKMLSSIQAEIVNMIDPFLVEPYAETFSGLSTMRIEKVVDEGKILYVYMPIADREAMARLVNSYVKLEYYREILKRPDKERRSFFLCDEFQSFFTAGANKGDADFFERSRQSNHANVIATQNIPALLKHAHDEAAVMNLLSNSAVKVFLRNSDVRTNEYASHLFGDRVETLFGTQTTSGRIGLSALTDTSLGLSGSAQYGATVRREVFATLAQPSAAEGIGYAESVVHLGSRGTVSGHRLKWKIHLLAANAGDV